MPPKLVTFDVTGTLLFFRTHIFEKYIQIGLKFGIQADPEILGRNFKEAWRTLNAEHPNFGRDTCLGWQSWWTAFVARTFTGYIKPEDVKIQQMAEDLIGFHTTKEAFTVRPGTEDLLEYLKAKKIKLGVISNYDPRLNQILEFMDLKKYFNFVLVSYDFGHSKPDKRIFEEALRLGGCRSADKGIHVGDDVETDYLGAKQSGMKAILINPDPKDLGKNGVEERDVYKDFFQVKVYFEAMRWPEQEEY